MAKKLLVGGGENTLIYRLNHVHAPVQDNGTSAATTAAHALLNATDEIESFNLDANGGTFSVTLLKAGGDVITFLDEYCTKKAGAEAVTAEAFGEGGTKHTRTISAGGGSFPDLLIVHKGATEGGTIHTTACVGQLSAECWNYETVYNDFTRLTLTGTLVEAKDAIAVLNAMLPNAAGYNASATITIAVGDPFKRADLAVAA